MVYTESRGLGLNLPLPSTCYSVASYFISYTSVSLSVNEGRSSSTCLVGVRAENTNTQNSVWPCIVNCTEYTISIWRVLYYILEPYCMPLL